MPHKRKCEEKENMNEDFVNSAIPAFPDYREFMEWYFLGKYKDMVD